MGFLAFLQERRYRVLRAVFVFMTTNPNSTHENRRTDLPTSFEKEKNLEYFIFTNRRSRRKRCSRFLHPLTANVR